MQIHYLEIVTPDIQSACRLYGQLYNVSFSEPDPSLGGARTAQIDRGGTLGIRAPMHDQEKPTVRPYFLVEDIEATVEKAAAAGATIALPPMEIPDHGTCAIVIQDEIETGLWQN